MNYDNTLINALKNTQSLDENNPNYLTKLFQIFKNIFIEAKAELLGYYIISFDMITKEENFNDEYIFSKSKNLNRSITLLYNIRQKNLSKFPFRHSEMLFKHDNKKYLTYTKLIKSNKNSIYQEKEDDIHTNIINVNSKILEKIKKCNINSLITYKHEPQQKLEALFLPIQINDINDTIINLITLIEETCLINFCESDKKYLNGETLNCISLLATNSEVNSFVYIPTVIDKNKDKEYSSGGLVMFFKENKKKMAIENLRLLQIITDDIFKFKNIKILKNKFRLQNLKTAIISILVDSYAHNISAHSLAALKWWFEQRVVEYDKRINYNNGDDKKNKVINNLRNLQPAVIAASELEKYAKISDKYYQLLGLDDSSNNHDYTSLMEFVRLQVDKKEEMLLTYDGYLEDNKVENYSYRYPVPIDFAVSKFFRFLRDKAAFWSGVTRDLPFGGEVKNLYDILWKDFAENPLFLGTIAHSEGIHKLIISIEFPKSYFNDYTSFDLISKFSNDKIDYVKLEFAIIDMSVIEYEEGLYKNNTSVIMSESKSYSPFFFRKEIKQSFLKRLNVPNDQISIFLKTELELTDEDDALIPSVEKKIISKLNQLMQKEKIWKKINWKKMTTLRDETKKMFDDNKNIALANRMFLEDYYPKCIITKNHTIDYSKYALIYPGKYHREIREELQKSDYNAFFPGGVVGKHALFTMFENTIRNIKHFNINHKMKEKGLNLNIRITPARLMSKDSVTLGSEEHKLFEIGVYLDHENSIYKIENVNKKPKLIRIKEILEEQTSKSIVDENGSPRLGGNSQDKICAAMLLNNQFISVDPSLKQENFERDKTYHCENDRFYWIGFNNTIASNEKVRKGFDKLISNCQKKLDSFDKNEIDKFLSDLKLNPEKHKTIKKKRDALFLPFFNKEYNGKAEELIKDNQGKLMKYFYLWKGNFIYPCDKVEDLENENVSRFKFVYVNSDELDETLELKLIDKGVIRILRKKDFEKIKEEYNHFIEDLENDYDKKGKLKDNKTLGKDKILLSNISNNINELKDKIVDKKELHLKEKFYIYLAWLNKFLDNDEICFYKCDKNPKINMRIYDHLFQDNRNRSSVNPNKIYFHHSGITHDISPSKIINYRSHGWMREKILKDDNFHFHFQDGVFVSEHFHFEEFIEVLLSKICIIDNRVFNRIDNKEEIDKYTELLNLRICKEFDVTNNANDKNDWNTIKKGINNNEYNFLIIHLSFIEKLGYSEENINKFFEDELSFKDDNIPKKFFVIITTGRGRSRWIECIDKKYKKISLFKPIESILDAVEQGVNFKDEIQIKYYLSKIIYGS